MMENFHVDFKPSEEVTKRSSTTYYFPIRLTGREYRNYLYSIYAFCRHTDDLVDDNEDNPELQDALTREWKKDFLRAYRKGHSDDPILNAFVFTMKKHNIPLRYPLELIKGMRMDIYKKEYKKFSELRRYCYRVASVVGLMLIHTMGVGKVRKAREYATKLGMAMQLTNILRDVGEDARMGRVYFPEDELARFGLCRNDILSLRKSPHFTDFLKFQLARARRYYEEAKPINDFAMIHKEPRLFISLAFTVCREILNAIEGATYEVCQKRPHVSIFRKISLALYVIVRGVPRDINYHAGVEEQEIYDYCGATLEPQKMNGRS
jgi:phytoene synthase